MTEAEVAERFVAARKAARGFPDFPGEVPDSLERAYAVQAAIVAAWPDAVAGWKVGRIVGGLADTLGSDRFIGPIFRKSISHPRHAGHVSASTPLLARMGIAARRMLNQLRHDGGGIAFPAIPEGSAVFEAELVIVVGADAPKQVNWSPEAAAALVGSMHIAIEAAGSPLATMPELGPLATIAAFGGNNGLIVGPEITDWRRYVPDDVSCTTTIDGVKIATACAAAVPGGPLTAFAFALGEAALLGRPIRRGDYISTGAITGMHQVSIGQRCTADFGRWGKLDCTVAPSLC